MDPERDPHPLACREVGVVGLTCVAVTGLLSLMVTWWSSPVDRANMTLYTSFDQRGIVPLGYAAFAFSLGVLAGVLVRRTLPAMAVTLVGFVAARLLFNHFALPKLFAPVQRSYAPTWERPSRASAARTAGRSCSCPAHRTFPAHGSPRPSSSTRPATPELRGHGGAAPTWALAWASDQVKPRRERGCRPSRRDRRARRGRPAPPESALQNCVTKLGATYHEVLAYQPASRYWPLQWYEFAIYLGVALVLAGAALVGPPSARLIPMNLGPDLKA